MRLTLLAVLFLGLLGGLALAQTPTSAQLELLKSMPASQREALLKQYGLDPSVLDELTDEADSTATTGRDGVRVGEMGRLSVSDKDAKRFEPEEPTLKPRDTVLVSVSIKTTPTAAKTNQGGVSSTAGAANVSQEDMISESFLDALRRGNPYLLDRSGQLALPGLPLIALGGLTEKQANQRLALEPTLLNVKVTISRLPVQAAGALGLKPFGYDLFDEARSAFSPATNVSVPADYVMGPGDRLSVQLYGGQNRMVQVTVNRDGALSFPELGPIPVVGKTFEAVREAIESRVAKQMIGTQANVSMAEARAIQVFVLGEAKRPGSYTVTGLSTVTSALYAAGGVATTGSLRDIQVKRQGSVVRRLDLYDLLLRGDTSNDAKILPGDVIFIPPAGSVASIDGEVRRPAIYELKGNVTTSGLVALAGGFTSEADSSRLSVVRIDEGSRRVAIDVSLGDARATGPTLQNGDAVSVARLRPTLDSGVIIEGHVFRPATVAWRNGLRLSEVIRSVDELKLGADLGYVLIRRELPPDRRVVVLSADLAAALREPGSAADVQLAARDRLTVFDIETGRERVIKPLLAELRRQGRVDQPTEVVSIGGQVKAPGEYPLEPAMRVSDLLRAGGRLSDAAFGLKAELTRFTSNGEERESSLLEIDLAAVLRGDAAADVKLQPFDALVVKELPEWSKQEFVTLKGEVRFPGRYPIRRGETLRSVIERAGGISGIAFTRGAVFTRQELKQREAEQIAKLTENLRSDLAALAIQAGQVKEGQDAAQGALSAQGLLTQLQGTTAVGRLVIDLDQLILNRVGSPTDVMLRGGDELIVPKIRQEVTIIGEVQNSTSLLHRVGLKRDDYIKLSGGFTRRADKSRAYVVRADGSVSLSEGGWLRGGRNAEIQPGDTIVVPLDIERLPPLPLWQAVTSIVYNAAVALAAIRTL
jgi:protein involved in polysaccharide export with SLBB domain